MEGYKVPKKIKSLGILCFIITLSLGSFLNFFHANQFYVHVH